MKPKDIIRMAHEAGVRIALPVDTIDPHNVYVHELKRFAVLVEQHLIESGYRRCAGGQRITQYCCMVEEAVKEEREAACDEVLRELGDTGQAATICFAIRARGEV